MLLRKAGGPTLLDEYLRAVAVRKFAYGSYDCCLFVCDGVLALTGVDVAAPFREKYSSRKRAYRAMESYAGNASVEAVTERVTSDYGMPEITSLRAQRGDVGLVRRKHDYSLALVGLDGRFVAAAEHGFEYVPSQLIARAWRV